MTESPRPDQGELHEQHQEGHQDNEKTFIYTNSSKYVMRLWTS